MVILACNPSARQTDPWGLLASQFSLLGRLQVNETLSQNTRWYLKADFCPTQRESERVRE